MSSTNATGGQEAAPAKPEEQSQQPQQPPKPEEAEESKEPQHPSGLTLDERFALARSVGEECIQEAELRLLLEKHPQPIAYDGFEPSGRMHIAQGVLKAINVNKLTQCGVKFVFWVADWFAMLNNKMGGNLKKIKKVGAYMVEVWKAAGMNMDNVEFLWAQEEINKRPNDYWMLVMDIARRNSISRIKRCATIMGREENDDMPAAQILYPAMQCADIFFLKANICQLGMDQRKVNMLAREYMDNKDVKKKLGKHKPVILSHHMLMGLKKGQAKMSKSDPDSAIFMEDERGDVKRKIRKAYCPEREVKDNPCLDYCKHIVFPKLGKMLIKRPKHDDGDKTYNTYEELEADFITGDVHPSDLKPCLTDAINDILEPVRQHFKNNAQAKELLKQVKSFKVTR
eukprot:TRINITY_DN13642_c0_g1_i1.p1 TRINITY_DN13642_c0_g1~~TRINITY_DN13642_c0_g1_i1.p1  ORF type:complete len:399 (-),score=243.39 TRINITY_DN13642_c0_g1_i1:62-1258(-)